MLSDDALRERAAALIAEVYGPYERGVAALIGDPSGVWIEADPSTDRLDGPLPLFIARADGSVVRFPRRTRYEADAVLRQWVGGGAIGAVALFVADAPEPPPALCEAWARAWLVHVPRYAGLHVPTAAELLAQMPSLATLDRSSSRHAV